jgi:hypothetical protein
MSFGNMFNEEALNASLIMQAQDTLRQLIAAKTQEGLADVSLFCKEQFKHAMDRFSRATVVIAEQGDPEKMVELVEQFRAYEIIKSLEEMNEFLLKRRRFSYHIHSAMVEASAMQKEEVREINREFNEKAKEFIPKVAEAGAFYDRVQLKKLNVAWNQLAEEWTEKLQPHIPQYPHAT